MLSTTNTINDIKAKLQNDYIYFGLASDAAFITSLTDCVDNVKYKEMIPYMSRDRMSDASIILYLSLSRNTIYEGQAYYDYIAAKNKVGLTLVEEYIYKAEIWFACSDFIDKQAKNEKFKSKSKQFSVSIPGFSKTINDSGSSKSELSSEYYSNALSMLLSAGINPNKIQGRT